MTKMKSKKMTKSTFAIIIMAIVMVAMLAFGGTYAYFTAQASGLAGSVTTGTLKLSAENGTVKVDTSNVTLVPNKVQDVINTDQVNVTGTTVAAYRIKFTVGTITGTSVPEDEELEAYKAKITIDILNDSNATLVIEDQDDSAAEGQQLKADAVSGWYDGGDGYFYYNTVSAGETVSTLSTIAKKVVIKLDSSADNTYQNITIAYEVVVEAAQAEYTDNSYTTTYTEGAKLTLAQVTGLPSWDSITQDNAA